MYNFFRWFPEGKIVFASHSRELVMQQIEACHKIVGIPQEWTIDLTGGMLRRAEFWKCKRVFFVSPQVLEKDIQSGSCLVKNLVCLVIDEAHRATGNYYYCGAVRELMDSPIQLRILALTATPGSKQQTIQHVINNLQISTLEYRNESDPDVMSFVHDRNIEVIQVSMGGEATDIDRLLLEAGHPFHAYLCTFGVLPNRDARTLRPCDILKSRDMFSHKPPASFPLSRHGEFLDYFGALITLHHLRKLLSTHSIRPAFEMLDEILKQGWFARMLGRNEALLKAKLLMQKTISRGAPSPKLVKMLEVLTEHFKVKDSKNSRVIIFSNFRGSVRDILDALQNIGQSVKATVFIGQNWEGQSHELLQTVLQKIWTGGYNVIVATSIGEEHLDITEFDLVICFDANVSPLRMIQRTGRTGRNKQARVVVLACEGTELSGYMRNQAKQRSISNLMINGGTGTNGFNFHPSPRMVPQFLEPELRFLQMPIGDVPRGVSEGVNQEPMRHPIRMKAPKGGSSSVTPPDSSETREANRATMYQVVQRALYADTSTMNPQQQDVHWKMILGLQKDLGL
ncbi:DEAD-box ATP-dependent RNA helicase FANCM-like [Salvia hispanica]|uniref:DEAD-box ATP-dependent RNA helicase FANCM-like n=1 Tax=Salvia hispanica TaxID=49212 RepID=UPI002009B838|nr:DEAD-box ATP-dependent RNA helicase FANCM-like [Salvia hispanica]XP_047983327.1 DEAD-box ATP-dependent RNA helicase FANCM-like [Salvia hispanica]XP_047983328.1 DEAD-box ATP-dependent RNA helicase FANCM-like [Salvia hispanica]